MTTITTSFANVSNGDLLSEAKRLAGNERHATAQLIACLAELDTRRLHLAEGCASLFTYCTHVLHLSEHAAYGRIEAARTARRFPTLLPLLADGSLTLTAVSLLGPHLSTDNSTRLLEAARHKSKREVELLVATLRPQPDVASSVRKLPAPGTLAAVRTLEDLPMTSPSLVEQSHVLAPQVTVSAVRSTMPPLLAATSRATVAPLAPERFKVQFTVNRETHDKPRRVQDLLRHHVPNGDVGQVFERAVTLLLEHLERTKLSASAKPRTKAAQCSSTRHIPAAVRREVWTRDGGRCAFVGTEGRCTETGFLEFHHVVPFASGGQTSTDNVQLRCRAHNAFEAELEFGLRPPMVREDRAS